MQTQIWSRAWRVLYPFCSPSFSDSATEVVLSSLVFSTVIICLHCNNKSMWTLLHPQLFKTHNWFYTSMQSAYVHCVNTQYIFYYVRSWIFIAMSFRW